MAWASAALKEQSCFSGGRGGLVMRMRSAPVLMATQS